MTLISNLHTWWQARQGHDRTDQSDSDLLRQYRDAGSAAAMDTLIQRHSHALYHFLLTLSDATMAEDISQQVWTGLIERPERYQQQAAAFRTWLFTIGRNRTIDELRRQQRWQWQDLNDERPCEPDEALWQEALVLREQDDLADAFDEALTSLSFNHREAISLQLEGFSLQDIANITNNKPETVKSRLRFARQYLKLTLEGHHD